MNKSEIWQVVESCLLASNGKDINYLIEQGLKPEFAKMGLQLCSYLESKKIEVKNE